MCIGIQLFAENIGGLFGEVEEEAGDHLFLHAQSVQNPEHFRQQLSEVFFDPLDLFLLWLHPMPNGSVLFHEGFSRIFNYN